MSHKTYRHKRVCFSPVNLSLSVKFADPARDPKDIRGNLFPPLHHQHKQSNECIHQPIHFPVPAIEPPKEKCPLFIRAEGGSERPALGSESRNGLGTTDQISLNIIPW